MRSCTIRLRKQSPHLTTYLVGRELFSFNVWVAWALGFCYHIDADQLRLALEELVEFQYPLLTGRLRISERGHRYVDNSNKGFSFLIEEDKERTLEEVNASFVLDETLETEPINGLPGSFVEPLQPHLFANGQDCILKVRLTNVQDGSVLGFSFAHCIADAEAMGQFIKDLAATYTKQAPLVWNPSRLPLQLLMLTAAGCATAEEKVVASLPQLQPVPSTFEGCVKAEMWDAWGLTLADRKVGAAVSHQVLHVPGRCLEQLRQNVINSAYAKQHNFTTFSVHDCISGLIWTIREAADGNDPSSGLKRPILFVADLRRHTAGALRTPERHWGNLVTTQVVQPPAASEPPPSDMTGCLHETLAAAACAVRSGVRSFYSDPEGLQKAWTGVLQMEDVVYWRNARTTPGFSPSRDSACCMSSWRGTSGESADFGQGLPAISVGRMENSLT
ncbi:hypothetical protein WJX84_005198 [Apatococcus fuscideae]|uniref:Uncharacterized protein n=1 Tax=Apatococcus fuscideae TaxID=2026836 RepID=A0AAW1SDA4_9CHLO